LPCQTLNRSERNDSHHLAGQYPQHQPEAKRFALDGEAWTVGGTGVYLGVDVGTSGCRAVAFAADDGRTLTIWTRS